MGRIAYLFSGQGAQKPGMGRELYEREPAAREIFDRLEALRPGTQRQCFAGAPEELQKTVNTQPCLFAVEAAAEAVLRARGVQPCAMAGFSLGEITALYCCGAVSLETGFALVQTRGKLMDEAAAKQDSGMAAVLKLPDEQVEELCASLSGVYPVNYNCPGQVVAAGPKDGLAKLSELVRAAGGRAVPLRVSGAFHSPYMADAAGTFGEALSRVTFQTPAVPLYSDATALPYEDNFRELLQKQICSPVRWRRLIENLRAAGIDTVAELGPGGVLTGLAKKTAPELVCLSVEDGASLAKTLEVLGC
jgi:[acyl-carrier-protein] S-malonyltransferase